MIKKSIFFVPLYSIITFFMINCVHEEIRTIDPHSQQIQQEEKIDCNYFWPARQVHVCIKEMPVSECENLFSLGQFSKENHCYCDKYNREKTYIKGQNYIQYDCK